MNELRVRLKNYRLTDPNIQYIWKIEPVKNRDMIKHSADNSALLLWPGALRKNSKYSVEVTIKILGNKKA